MAASASLPLTCPSPLSHPSGIVSPSASPFFRRSRALTTRDRALTTTEKAFSAREKRTHLCVHAQSRANPDKPDADANIVLRLAWYGAEALGNIVAVFNPKPPESLPESGADTMQGPLTRENVVEAVKDDYVKAYFVTGNVSTGIYEENCEFADPAGSFKSLKRFKTNCSNFGSLLEKSDVKLTKSEEFNEKFVAYWRFSCVLKFPWRPVLSSTGFTEYYFQPESGKICRHVENWDVPKMALLGQVFKSNPGLRS
uniref:Uncharacterized protein n=1 Tax=Hymenophyllum caudiculatum TaxID=295381 RepID=A0A2R4N4R6_9MONI|nr:hypothetical protein [Hymenophyllum caudiculatum]